VKTASSCNRTGHDRFEGRAREVHRHAEHVLHVTLSIEHIEREEEEELASDMKCRIRTALPCYCEERDVIGDHRVRRNCQRKLDVRV
jgi:hypothetical protein